MNKLFAVFFIILSVNSYAQSLQPLDSKLIEGRYPTLLKGHLRLWQRRCWFSICHKLTTGRSSRMVPPEDAQVGTV